MTLSRRTLLQAGAAPARGRSALRRIAQAPTKVRVGYLHTLAVDGQIWLGQHLGALDKHGLDLELMQFTTGLELFQAMIGGSLDMLSTGAVISNFPARGQGKVFLANNVEFATAQLWVRDDGSRGSPTSRASRSRRRPARPRTSSSTPRCAPTTSTRKTSRSSTSAWPRR